jgi:sirohydrochlorin ferrochelatase
VCHRGTGEIARRRVAGVPGESSDVLFDHAVHVGAALGGADADEVVAELLALSRRRRQSLEDALARIRYLHPGDDAARAEDLLRAALRRGDATDYWRIDLTDS